MTPREANVLLTRAALFDGRLRREAEERAEMAKAWALLLADLELDAALAALTVHYREETRVVMPADIITTVEDSMFSDHVRPADGRAWLLARGINPDEFQRRVALGESPSRLIRELRKSVES